MQPKHHILLYTFLGLAVITAGIAAFSYGLQAQRSAQALEDAYAQRLSETQEHLQSIVLKLGKTPLAQDAGMQVELLSGISRQADGVVSGLSALPLSYVAMSDTLKFCNQLSEYAMSLALLAAGGENMDESALQQLDELETQCTQLLGQFAAAREAMLRESLHMAAQPDLFYQEAQADVRPLEQLADGDNGMDYPSMIYDGAFSDARRSGSPKALGKKQIDAEQAVDIARRFVGESRVQSAAQAAQTGGVIPCFGVSLTLNDGLVLNAEVTQTGGKLLWIMPESAEFESALSLESCIQSGRQFLKAHGYGDMEANHYQVYDGLAVINFVAVQDGVLLYPDLVKVQLRMDTGELVGLESNNYLMNHAQRSALVPVWTRDQALEKGSTRLESASARLCVIPYRDEERLCYEISGQRDGGEYRLYLDAATGDQLEILKMIDAPEGRLAAGGSASLRPWPEPGPLNPSRKIGVCME